MSIKLPGAYGELQFESFTDGSCQGVLAINGDYGERPFVRIHSSCLFSEAFRTYDCDCALQLEAALDHIKLYGGMVIYLYQEGRGVGLAEKIRAISLEQASGCDTATAFAQLGHDPDPRVYDSAVRILKEKGISKISLATNNPKKIAALTAAGIDTLRIKLSVKTNPLIDRYLQNKQKALGHHA